MDIEGAGIVYYNLSLSDRIHETFMLISSSQIIDYALPFMSINKTKRRILQRGNRLIVTPPTKLYYDERSPYCVRYILLSNMNKIKDSTSLWATHRHPQKTISTIEIHVGILIVPEQPLQGLLDSTSRA